MEFWEFVVLQVAVTELRTPRTTPRCTKVRVVDLHLDQGNEDSLQMLQSDHEWCGVAGLQWHSSWRVIAAVLLVEKVT